MVSSIARTALGGTLATIFALGGCSNDGLQTRDAGKSEHKADLREWMLSAPYDESANDQQVFEDWSRFLDVCFPDAEPLHKLSLLQDLSPRIGGKVPKASRTIWTGLRAFATASIRRRADELYHVGLPLPEGEDYEEQRFNGAIAAATSALCEALDHFNATHSGTPPADTVTQPARVIERVQAKQGRIALDLARGLARRLQWLPANVELGPTDNDYINMQPMDLVLWHFEAGSAASWGTGGAEQLLFAAQARVSHDALRAFSARHQPSSWFESERFAHALRMVTLHGSRSLLPENFLALTLQTSFQMMQLAVAGMPAGSEETTAELSPAELGHALAAVQWVAFLQEVAVDIDAELEGYFSDFMTLVDSLS